MMTYGNAICECECTYSEHYCTFGGDEGCSQCDCSGFEDAPPTCVECGASGYEEDFGCDSCGWNPGGYDCRGYTKRYVGEFTLTEQVDCEFESRVNYAAEQCDDCQIVERG